MIRLPFLLLLAAALLSACDSEEVPDATVEQNDRLVQEIVERFDVPEGGFTKLTGSYQDSVSSPEAVTVVAHCRSCRPSRLIDDVVAAVWQSEIAPLRTVSVSVHGPDGYQSETFSVADDEAELTERYGERPA